MFWFTIVDCESTIVDSVGCSSFDIHRERQRSNKDDEYRRRFELGEPERLYAIMKSFDGLTMYKERTARKPWGSQDGVKN